MAKKSSDSNGAGKGPQQHAEGEHGERTRARSQEQIKQSAADPADNIISRDETGKHRLSEGREQHDEAERNSEFNRVEENDIVDPTRKNATERKQGRH